MDVILYGLSGNPTHIGHLKIADKVSNMCDEVWMMLSYKSFNKNYMFQYDRIKILELSIKDFDNQKIVPFNYLLNNRISEGTNDTLKRIKSLFPNINFKFLIGYDNVVDITNWIDYQQLLENNKFIIVNRKIKDLDKFDENIKLFDNYELVHVNLNYDISSTLIRNNYSEYNNFLTPSARKYIEQFKLI